MREFLGAAFRSFSGRLLGAASALVASYAVTSNLSVADSGLFFLSLGFTIFFSHVLRFGLDSLVMKRCAICLSEGDRRGFLTIVSASVLICLAGSALLYAGVYVSGLAVRYEYLDYLLLAYPAAILTALLGIVGHSLHSSGYVFVGAATNLALHYVLFTLYVYVFGPSDASGFIRTLIAACGSAFAVQSAIALFAYAKRGIGPSEWRGLGTLGLDYREIFGTTLPFWIIVIAQQLNQWSSQFISSVHVGERDLALLAIAARLALLVPMILTAVNMVVSPRFAAHHHRGESDKTEHVLADSLKVLSAVSLLVFLVMVAFGDDVLHVFGEQYVEAAGLLFVLVCGQLINSLTGPCGKLLMMSGFEKDVRNSSVVVALLALPVTFYLAARHGVYGAAVSTALTISVQNLVLAWTVHRRLDMNLLSIYFGFFRRAGA